MNRRYVVSHLAPEREDDRAHNEEKRYSVVPLQVFTKVCVRERHEHAKRDNFLYDFQLEQREFPVADTIRRHLEAILEERDQPANQNRGNQRRFAVLEMPIPGDSHESIRANEQQDGFHGARG
jgi:hypothetical protein